MGKKQFISKKNATKFDLIFRSDADPGATPQREWVESSRKVGIGRPDIQQVAESHRPDHNRRYPDGHPLAWLDDSEQDVLTDERRAEIIALGFPDDGYDYLKHMRRGHATESAEEGSKEGNSEVEESYSGPSVYISAPAFEAPPQDYKAIDASRLTVHQAATSNDDASLISGGATAFARELSTIRRRHQQEIDEMAGLMRRYEDLDGSEEGDLLEDFVLTATEVGEAAEPAPLKNQPALPLVAERAEVGSDGSDWDEGSETSSSDAYHPSAPRSEAKSFASTYWRPERTDRNANLSVIDERFERLALEYDSDDIGELDDLEDDPSTRGGATTDQYADIMEDFLATHATQDHAHEGGQEYVPPSATSRAGAAPDGDASVASAALAKTRERLRSLEEQEACLDGEKDDAELARPEEQVREQWDCESVLTTRSTLYNHPAKLDAGEKPRKKAQIQLSAKTGLPLLKSSRGGGAESSSQPTAERPAPLQRQPDESAQEKKDRKNAIKEVKRQARASKKELKMMFKEGSQKQKQTAGPAVSTFRIP